MALTPRLELRQSQSLVMTPQLQQAIKLLQLSNVELASYVEEQVEKNPLLDIDDKGADGDRSKPDNPTDSQGGSGPDVDSGSLASTDDVLASGQMGQEKSDAIDADTDSLYTDDTKTDLQNDGLAGSSATVDWSNAKSNSRGFDDDGFDLESTLSETLTLREHLTEQLQISPLSPQKRVIGSYLIDSLDEAGYLQEDLSEVSVRLGAELCEVEDVLKELQQFDPAGVCCRSLAECLALQLKDKNRLDPAMQAMLDNLELLAKRDMRKLEDVCGVGLEDITDMVAEIRELNPKPGLAFSHEVVDTVVPDVFVRQKPDGSWFVELNSETLPRVLLDQSYYAEVSTNCGNEKTAKAYISDCFHEANWLIKSLDQRAKTILKVSSEIVRQQDAFFVYGIHHLRPLNLKTVADAIEMHESTVSRVTTNKYISTPRGVFELKYFFTSAIASSDGSVAHSAESVRYRIKKLIDEESPRDILSDDKIVEILRTNDIDIARRTVAKYREAMKIPSSIQRRRLKKEAV